MRLVNLLSRSYVIFKQDRVEKENSLERISLLWYTILYGWRKSVDSRDTLTPIAGSRSVSRAVYQIKILKREICYVLFVRV